MRYETERTGRRGHPDSTTDALARGLGVFSIALGLVEVVAARSLTRALGMEGNEALVRLYGLREIATGVGILASNDPTPWIWGRVAGDALDSRRSRPGSRATTRRGTTSCWRSPRSPA